MPAPALAGYTRGSGLVCTRGRSGRLRVRLGRAARVVVWIFGRVRLRARPFSPVHDPDEKSEPRAIVRQAFPALQKS